MDLKTKWNPMKHRAVPAGPGVALPSAFEAELTLAGGMRATLELEVVDGSLRCVSLRLTAATAKRITAEATRLPIQAWVDLVASATAMVTAPGAAPGVTELRPPVTDDEARRVVGAVRAKRRRTVDDELLRRAADAYRIGGAASVQAVLSVSEATAYRYIRMARERGLPQRGEN